MAGDPTREADYMAEDLMLFRSGLFSDVIVTCGPKLWNLHMNILSVRSVWFEKAIRRLLMDPETNAIRLRGHDPDAVDICLSYIYGGVGSVNIVEETRLQQPFQFCAELYRSADYFLLEPLLPIVQRHLRALCNEKIRWMYTRGNVREDREEKKALVWVEDLKTAIRDVHRWQTPVVKEMLMEFVWAGRQHFLCIYPRSSRSHLNIQGWLIERASGFIEDMDYHCNPESREVWTEETSY